MPTTKGDIVTIKVSTTSVVAKVAGAIAGFINDGRTVEVQSIGAEATNQAVKSVALASEFLKTSDIRIWTTPEMLHLDDRRDTSDENKLVAVIRFPICSNCGTETPD